MDNNSFRNFVVEDLKGKKCWVGWKAVWKSEKNKYNKIPIDPNTGEAAKTNDENTWTTFDTAAQSVSKYNLIGIGFVFTKDNGLVGIDIDNCRDINTGELSDLAKEIIETIDSYTEISPSGKGIHILSKGKLPANGRKNQSLGLEMYDSGRFFTVTGKHIPATPDVINEAETGINVIHKKYICKNSGGDTLLDNAAPGNNLQAKSKPTDDELIKKAMGFSNGNKFSQLWNGDWKGEYKSQSEADLSLCSFLAFLTGGDSDKMDKLFRQSGLFRPKWDEHRNGSTYGEMTIRQAIENCHSEYSPNPMYKKLSCLDKPSTTNKNVVKVSQQVEYGTDCFNDAIPWPERIGDAAFYGPAGDFVRLVEPHSEADPVALLINLLVTFGNIVEKSAHFSVEAKNHYMNLFAVLVGQSARGRKGSSWGWIEKLFKELDSNYVSNNIINGLSSGEGLINRVKDDVCKEEAIIDSISKETTGYKNVIVEPGIKDKRVLVVEEEFANALKVMKREGNNLSPICRKAWDGDNLQVLTRNSPLKSTQPHISVIAHITKDELNLQLSEVELLNGMANRFLWFCVRRSKLLPYSGHVDETEFKAIAQKIQEAKVFAENTDQITFDPEVEAEWCRISTSEDVPKGIYQTLSSDSTGITASVLSRAEAQVMRLACIYALLDRSTSIHMEHMNAALAVWKYCESSVQYIFGTKDNNNDMSAKILEALKQNKQMTQSEIYRQVFNCNVTSKKVADALQDLSARGQVKCVKQSSGTGRPSKIWMIS